MWIIEALVFLVAVVVVMHFFVIDSVIMLADAVRDRRWMLVALCVVQLVLCFLLIAFYAVDPCVIFQNGT